MRELLRKWWFWAACGVLLLVVAGGVVLSRDMLASETARKLGLSNEPDSETERKRLVWLQGRRSELLAVLGERFPGVRMASAYRSDAVNAAVGGSKTSRHRLGLALDFVVNGGTLGTYEEMGRHLRAQSARLSVQPRDVLAESTPPHLHVDYFDPLNIEEPASGRRATAYRSERDMGENKFAALV